MELQGKTIEVLAKVTGEGKNGTWEKQEIILETAGQYPKKVCISMWGDKINQDALCVGTEINAHIDIESREYNGRWYTELKAYRIDVMSQGAPTQQPPKPEFIMPEESAENLPF